MEKTNKTDSVKKSKLSLKAEPRKIFGRKIKKLRADGLLPANVYGKDIKSQALKIALKEFLSIFKQAGETGIVYLTVGKSQKTDPVLIHNLQLHPVSDQPLHVDFHKIDLKQKVQVDIPIELIGEAPGVAKGGVLVQLLDEVEVEALPTDLPEKFEIDISSLTEIGQSIIVKELKVDKTKVKLLIDENQLVVKVEEPKKEEEEEKPAEEAPAEGEVAEEEKPEEGKEATPEEKAKEGEKPEEQAKPEDKAQADKTKPKAKKEDKK